MNTCPNCGKIAGLHSSILQGCMCQYSTKALPQREWQRLTDEEICIVIEASQITLKNYCSEDKQIEYARAIETMIKDKNYD